MPGFTGIVTLISPAGEVRRVVLSGWEHRRWCYQQLRAQSWREDREFYRLLSLGWRVVPQRSGAIEEPQEGDPGSPAPKGTDEVDGSIQSGAASHGGKHASCEVADSPNAAQHGRELRGKRGGRRRGKTELSPKKGPKPVFAVAELQQESSGGGSLGGFVFGGLRITEKVKSAAAESAELLMELTGLSDRLTQKEPTVDSERLVIGLETDDLPEVLAALEAREEKRRIRVLITPDCSGSTQDWSGLGAAWALLLSEAENVDVMHIYNYNGEIKPLGDKDVSAVLSQVDIVVYLGDQDGLDLCRKYAQGGACVVAMDCHCANSLAGPRCKVEKVGQGQVFWVDRVSAKDPATWTEGVRCALGS